VCLENEEDLMTHPDIPVELANRAIVVTQGRRGHLVWDRYAPAPLSGGYGALPIILVHGSNHSAAIYQKWGEYFAQLGFTVYAPDLRGHGRSKLPTGHKLAQAHVWQYAEDVLTVVQTEGLIGGRFVLVGHSLGGATVQLYARAHPVAGLVILASTALSRFMPAFGAVFWFAPVAYLRAMLQGPATMFDSPAKIRRYLLEPDANDETVQMVRNQLCGESKVLTPECLRWMRQGDQPLRTQQVLVLGGEADRFFPPVELSRCARRYAADGARLQVVAQAPHDLMVSRARQVCADHVVRFATEVAHPEQVDTARLVQGW
jgi:pimeloyl-ACP methyl ester carboxylesterase